MAIVTEKKNRFEPIIVQTEDGKTIEICSCGQTTNEDRTCTDAHNILNAEIEAREKARKSGKKLTVLQILNKINKEDKEGPQCACGGNCGCSHE